MNNLEPSGRSRRLAQQRESAVQRVLNTFPGLQLDSVLRRLDEQLGATNTLIATSRGKITDTLVVPDNGARQAALTTALQLHNAFPAKQFDISTTVRIEQLQALVVQMSSLSLDQLDVIEAEAERAALPSGD